MLTLVLLIAALAFNVVTSGDAPPGPTDGERTPRRAEVAEEGEQSSANPEADPIGVPANSSAERIIRGRVVTASGQAIPAVSIRDSAGKHTRTSRTGEFAMPTVPPIVLMIEASGYDEVSIEVARGVSSTIDLGDIVLRGAASVVVEVRDEDGTPVPDAVVDWSIARSTEGVLNPRRNPLVGDEAWIPAGTTGRGGEVSCDGVPVQRSLLWRASLRTGAVTVVGPQEIDRSGPRRIRIVIGPVFRLRVECRYADGMPVGDVRVTRDDGPPWARWSRRVPNPDGTVEIPLPPGRYTVGVLAAGRFLREKSIDLTADTSVELGFDRLVRIRVQVLDEAGESIPAFRVAQLPGDPGHPIAYVQALFIEGTTFDGHDGLAEVMIPIGAAQPGRDVDRRTLVAMAPGFGLGRATIGWSAVATQHEVTIHLPAGVTIEGSAHGLPAGTIVRLYYRKDRGGAGWSAESAPLLDTATAGTGGDFTLRGLGPGRYEVRAEGPVMEIPLGELEVSAPGRTTFTGSYEPATLAIRLMARDDGSVVEPVLRPLLSQAGWGRGETPSDRYYAGSKKGTIVRFVGVAPGRYLLGPLPGSGPEPPGAGRVVTLAAGESREEDWDYVDTLVPTRFTVKLPGGIAPESVLVAIHADEEPTFAASLDWRPLADGGHAEILVPRDRTSRVVIARFAPRGTILTGMAGVLPLRVVLIGRPADIEGAVVAIDEPSSIVVRTDGAESVLVRLRPRDTADFLRDQFLGRAGVVLSGLMPGSWEAEVSETGVQTGHPRRGRTEFVLGPGESEEIYVEVR